MYIMCHHAFEVFGSWIDVVYEIGIFDPLHKELCTRELEIELGCK